MTEEEKHQQDIKDAIQESNRLQSLDQEEMERQFEENSRRAIAESINQINQLKPSE